MIMRRAEWPVFGNQFHVIHLVIKTKVFKKYKFMMKHLIYATGTSMKAASKKSMKIINIDSHHVKKMNCFRSVEAVTSTPLKKRSF